MEGFFIFVDDLKLSLTMANEIEPPQSFFLRIINVFDKVEPIPILTLSFLLFGGIHQIVSLITIGFPYLRFFSGTQLLSDSLALFLLILFYFIIPIIIGVLYTQYILKISLKIENRAFSLLIHGLIFIPVILYVLFEPDLINTLFNKRESFFKLDANIIAICIFTMTYSTAMTFYSQKGEVNLVKELFSMTPILLIMIIFTTFVIVEILGNNSFNEKLENFNKIHQIYKAKNIKDNILYFNDNYIFVEIKKDTLLPNMERPETITKIEILKFDKFFE